ncbi:MAG: hypothetical protein V2A70_04415, partial [Candidatus Omnitrophota bacterium]
MKRNNTIISMLNEKRRGFLASCAFLLGFLSVLAQVVIIRELMVALGGNELVFAIVLGTWLVGAGLGSLLFRRVSWPWVGGFLAASVLLLPVVIVGARLLNHALGIPLGSMADFGRVALGSAALVLPLAIVSGGLFSALVRLGEDAVLVYAFEAAGFAMGGLVMAFVFWVPLTAGLDQWSRAVSWSGYAVLKSEQTHYGCLMVVERSGQRSLFENGRHLFTGKDALSSEEIHPALLWHPAPKSVFLVGGGFSEAGREALKYPLQRLDYVQLDPAALRLEREYFAAVKDERLHLRAGDPRRVLKDSSGRYDVVIINAGDPVSLLSARLFSREFFEEVRLHLMPGGIVALTQGLSEDYVSPQGRAYASSIYAT